jgi:rhodanese-related sulfurtransferase
MDNNNQSHILNLKNSKEHILKTALIILIALTLFVQLASGQSVYVGQAGTQGKVLKQYIDPAALKRLTKNPVDSIWIIDVRSEKAFQNGHIPTAKSFPAGTITNRFDEIPKTKYLIIYCTVGANAKIASKYLKKAGYKRYINWGGISRWEGEKATEISSYPKQ